MSVFPRFGGWFNQNNEHPSKAESRRSHENVKSNSVSEKHTNLKPWYDEPGKNEANEPGEVRSKNLYAVDPKYYDVYELKRQAGLWLGSAKTNPWHDAPAKMKVKTKNEFILGEPPQGTYEMLTNPRNVTYFDFDKRWRQRLENKATKVLKNDGPRQITDVRKALRWKLLWFSGAIPIHLIIDENHQNLTAIFTKKKNKMKYMKMFEGSWKIEPLYIDSERLCKHFEPRSAEEYKKCSGGQERIASNVTMELIFQPSYFLNMPPVSWIIRWITIKSTKILLEDIRQFIIAWHNGQKP